MCAGYNFSNTCTSICVSKLKHKKTQEWWGRPVIPAAHEVQAGELQINSSLGLQRVYKARLSNQMRLGLKGNG